GLRLYSVLVIIVEKGIEFKTEYVVAAESPSHAAEIMVECGYDNANANAVIGRPLNVNIPDEWCLDGIPCPGCEKKKAIMENDIEDFNASLDLAQKMFKGEKATCPDCGGMRFLEGPHGGLCVNIKCSECGSTFNVNPPFFAERIGGEEPQRIEDGQGKTAPLNAA
ncbi:MAG: hypothetical protein NTY64_22955, partial [Deltaproteobacteria bacterium]|nr:hypothetical protein [Deltaproteobacteria bacterium]